MWSWDKKQQLQHVTVKVYESSKILATRIFTTFLKIASNNISVNLCFDLPFCYFLQFLPFPSLEEVKHGKVFGYFLYRKQIFIFWYASNWWKSNNMAWNIHLILYFIIKILTVAGVRTLEYLNNIFEFMRTISVHPQLSSVINFKVFTLLFSLVKLEHLFTL